MKTEVVSLATPKSRLGDFLALTKPRLNSLVVITTGVGYFLGAYEPGSEDSSATIAMVPLLHTVMGSALVAGGAAALNQVAERDIDLAMHRTQRRPLPSARVTPKEARTLAIILSTLGIGQLAIVVNPLAALVALMTLLSYVVIYTPLKRRTHWATWIGAVPGALPALIGWAAARGSLDAAGWAIFGIVFLWQLPHFHALSWMYREDFRRANLPLLAVIDTDGRRTARHALACSVLLVPVSVLPSLVGLGEQFYVAAALILGTIFTVLSARFLAERSHGRARMLFLGSLAYLPLLWGFLVFDVVH